MPAGPGFLLGAGRLVALPAYIVVAVTLVALIDARFGRPPFLLELAIYIGLGVLWALPLKAVFKAVDIVEIANGFKVIEARK